MLYMDSSCNPTRCNLECVHVCKEIHGDSAPLQYLIEKERIQFYPEGCTVCLKCVRVCPFDAIRVSDLQLTQQESAQAAFSYVRGKMFELDIAKDLHKNFDIHIHVPEGATPKEGPSAGITIATSIISLLTGIPVRKKVAMSGEITLKGKVLSVGGIKEKLLAAHREGIKEVILPADNKPDLKDMPKNVKDDIIIHFVERMDQVLRIALVKDLPKKGKIPIEPKVRKGEEKREESQEPPITH